MPIMLTLFLNAYAYLKYYAGIIFQSLPPPPPIGGIFLNNKSMLQEKHITPFSFTIYFVS